MSTANFDVPGLPLPVAVTRHRTARRMRLRVDHDAGLIRLTVLARASAKAALGWAKEQRLWVDAQLAAAPAAVPLEPGATIPFRGEPLELVWTETRRRSFSLHEGRLTVGGPRESFSSAVERWLRRQALDMLSAETARIAAEAGVVVRSVGVGDPVSRWGSCTSSGAIRYSWRLILAPPDLLRFVVAHEVAHRLLLDHSPRFKAVEEKLFGRPVAEARALLRELAPTLRAVGRS